MLQLYRGRVLKNYVETECVMDGRSTFKIMLGRWFCQCVRKLTIFADFSLCFL